MKEFSYYKAYDDGNIIIRANKAKRPDEFTIQRYNPENQLWIEDFDLCGIYSGDIPVRVLTETQANKIIKNGRHS